MHNKGVLDRRSLIAAPGSASAFWNPYGHKPFRLRFCRFRREACRWFGRGSAARLGSATGPGRTVSRRELLPIEPAPMGSILVHPPGTPITSAASGHIWNTPAWESCLGLVPNSRQARPLPAPDGFARIQAIVGVPIRGAGPSRGTSAATLHYLSAPPAGQAFGLSRPAPGDSDGEPTTLPAGPPQAVLDQGENGQEKRHEADDGIQADHHGRGA